jgi:hypothetical protein
MPSDIEARVRQAYAQELFHPTYEEVINRRGNGGRRLVPFGAVVATAAVTVGLILAVASIRELAPQRAASAWESAFAAQCASWWSANATASPVVSDSERSGLPVRFSFRDGETGLRLYTDGTLLFACTRDGGGGGVTGSLYGNGRTQRPFARTTAQSPVPYLAVYDQPGPQFVIGPLPAGVNSVTVHWEFDHAPEPAVVQGGYFADWGPHGGLENTWMVTNRGGDSWPSHLRGNRASAVLPEQCRRDLIVLLGGSGIELGRLNSFIVTDVRLHLSDDGVEYLFYGDAHLLTLCTFDEYGEVVAGPVIGQSDEADAASAIYGVDHRSWAFGRGRIGQTQVDLRLADGRTIEAQVNGLYYAAAWTTDGDDVTDPARHGVVETRFHTPQGVYSNLGGTVHRIG